MFTPELFHTLKSYSLRSLRDDTLAGITVAMVALPLSLAIAIASGATPAQGLVTAIVGGLLISALGGSRVQIGGPTGAFIVVVFSVIAQHGYDGLVIATFMAGGILILAGSLNMGRLVAYVPEAVINGFTIGIAVIIASSQIKDAFGLAMVSVPADFLEKIPALWQARASLSLPALTIAFVTGILIVALRRAFPRLPGLIVAVALTSLACHLWQLPVETIASRFGPLPNSLPAPHLPVLTLERISELLPSALVIAFLAGVESLLSAMVADRMIAARHDPDTEVIAQGVANMASALFAGMPVTGAIARTATNIQAGARSPVAGMIHAVVILVMMWLAAPLAGYLAMPAMAALLILVAWNMSEPHKWRSYLQGRRRDRILLLVTLGLTVLTDLTVAIGTGVALGLALRLQDRRINPDWTPPER